MQKIKEKSTSTVAKGDALEDAFYRYLTEQKRNGKLVDDLYKAASCRIYKKKSYYCREREAAVQFDVVIEVWRKGADVPTKFIVFECKHYEGQVPERAVTDFSDKLQRIFKHNVKGALIFSSKLQSGARNLATKRGLSLIKYDNGGFEYIVQRQSRSWVNANDIKHNMFHSPINQKSMIFSAYYDGVFYDSLASLMNVWMSGRRAPRSVTSGALSLPYLSRENIEIRAENLLSEVSYLGDAVNLSKVCNELSLKLEYMKESCIDGAGNEVLGIADFKNRCIKIYPHKIRNRERFTIAHEIGHFYLGHSKFLASESVVENDLFVNEQPEIDNFYRSMEFQANLFASSLLLPKNELLKKIYELKRQYEMPRRSYPVYIDDQTCNIRDYNILMNELVSSFEASKTAIEIRLKELNFLVDNRETYSKFRKNGSGRGT